ncbi:hypothetical protein OIU76_009117 [Salix suchowensis]|nr:hypothetical protein OIU76_009117 [Salix suchowensis]
MSSVCISNCVHDARDPRVPVRANYVNLHRWPEPDAELVKSVRRVTGHGLHGHPKSGGQYLLQADVSEELQVYKKRKYAGEDQEVL